jgi:hypothetical protein
MPSNILVIIEHLFAYTHVTFMFKFLKKTAKSASIPSSIDLHQDKLFSSQFVVTLDGIK